MRACAVSDEQISIIKLARQLGYMNHEIAAYFVINQGRVAEVNTGQRGEGIRAADQLPADFPPLLKAA